MPDTENREIEKEARDHRRMGGAFDTFASFLRGVKQIIFRNSVTVEDRGGVKTASELNDPSSFVKARSVYETYHRKEANSDGANLMYIGRSGKGGYKNTQYLEVAINSTEKADDSLGNGKFIMTMHREGVLQDGYMGFVDLARSSDSAHDGLTGTRWFISGGDGTAGGVQLSRTDSDGNITHYFIVDEDGIQSSHAVTVTSDIRFKQNIRPLGYGLKEIERINPIVYEREGKTYLGFSAQELQKIVPEIVLERRSSNEGKHLAIKPDEIVPILLNAVKELSGMVSDLEIRLAEIGHRKGVRNSRQRHDNNEGKNG